MDCRDKILSNNFYDVITDFPINITSETSFDLCYVNVEETYNLIYINSMGLPRLLDNPYDYQNIPKLYGLMEDTGSAPGFNPNNLIASGISQVQGPPLGLTGRGVVLCFIDTGEGVELMQTVRREKTFPGAMATASS